MSCPSIDFCAAGDSYGEAGSTTHPLGGTAWTGGGPSAGEYDTLSCASQSLCVGSCPPGVGFNGQNCEGSTYDGGTIVSWDPATWLTSASPSVRFSQISAQPLTGVWCQTNSLCFATDGSVLYGSVSPGGGPSAWTAISDLVGAASSVACPSPTRCVAVTPSGTIMLGSPPPTRNQILNLLRLQISPPRLVRTKALLEHGGYSFRFNAPTAGRLQISWTSSSHPGRRGAVVLAGVTHNYPSAATALLKLHLTRAGRKLLSATPTVRLTIKGAFTAAATGTTVTAKKLLTLD